MSLIFAAKTAEALKTGFIPDRQREPREIGAIHAKRFIVSAALVAGIVSASAAAFAETVENPMTVADIGRSSVELSAVREVLPAVSDLDVDEQVPFPTPDGISW